MPWWRGTALPFWAEHGFDVGTGLFRERLTLDGAPDPVGYRRFLVQARQTIVFSQAAVLLGDARYRQLAEAGLRAMQRYQHPEGGFVHRLTETGAPLAQNRPLYEQAFALSAFAWAYRAIGSPEALALAAETATFLESAMAHPAGGFVEGLGEGAPPGHRRQNPHMHLLESWLCLFEASGEEAWLARADAIVVLALKRFVDPALTLGEHFQEGWAPATGEAGLIREPGHHFEWAWLLDCYQRLGGRRSVETVIDGLLAFALTHGLDRQPGGVFAALDEVDPQGRALRDSKRFWPQAEALRGVALMGRSADHEDREAARRLAEALLKSVFSHWLTPGDALLRDRLTRDGAMIDHYVPATSLYHMAGAVYEIDAVFGD